LTKTAKTCYIFGGTPLVDKNINRLPPQGDIMAKPQASPPKQQHTRGFSRFKRSETSRLVRGVIDAGLPVRGIEADPDTGKLRVLVGKPGEAHGTSDDTDLDCELAEWEGRGGRKISS
jgi:hypothetical protein